MFDGRGISRFLICERCGDRIGLYEQMWVRDASGNVTATGGPDARQLPVGGQAFHAGCLVPDDAPEP